MNHVASSSVRASRWERRGLGLELRVDLATDRTTVKRMQRSRTFGGSVRAADRAPRCLVDQLSDPDGG
jgi:hypothetical protein